METERYYRESGYYRAWVDASGDGSVRILKRVNFRVLVHLFKEMLAELKNGPMARTHITFYISKSLNDEMSDNAREFIDFCRYCMDIDLELVILE